MKLSCFRKIGYRFIPATVAGWVMMAGVAVLVLPGKLYCQSGVITSEFGIAAGGLTNFPANKDYLKKDINVFYVAPYIRIGRHEFSAGMVYPLSTPALHFNDDHINPMPGAIAGYKYYIFNTYNQENLFIHYSFQYLRFKGTYENYNEGILPASPLIEKDMYINNVIGLGYTLYFDQGLRFGLYYTLDYIISQTGYNISVKESNNTTWITEYIWNNLSTHIGFTFKLAPIKKKVQK